MTSGLFIAACDACVCIGSCYMLLRLYMYGTKIFDRLIFTCLYFLTENPAEPCNLYIQFLVFGSKERTDK